MSNSFHHNQPISNHFYTWGTDGIGTHRIEERRAADRELAAAHATTRRSGIMTAMRRTVGSWLIAAGERTLNEYPATATVS